MEVQRRNNVFVILKLYLGVMAFVGVKVEYN